MLISDGGQGGGADYDTVRTALLASDARVHAIALGEDADQGLLQEIATETGGSYEYVPLPIPSQGFANALADALRASPSAPPDAPASPSSRDRSRPSPRTSTRPSRSPRRGSTTPSSPSTGRARRRT